MLNTIMIVGIITNDLKIENGFLKVVLGVARNYQNEKGIYETDFLTSILSGTIAKDTANKCKKGDTIAIKGRIQNKETKGNNKNLETIIFAEKVSFLHFS